MNDDENVEFKFSRLRKHLNSCLLFASPDEIPNDQINDEEGQSDTEDDNDNRDENGQVAEDEDGK